MVEVNIGAEANDGTGDPLRTAFAKVNADISLVKSEIAELQADMGTIELLPSLEAILESEAVSTAAAAQAATSAAVVDAALEGRSNAIFGVGDSNGGLTYTVVIAQPAFVSEDNTLPYPTVDVEIETGVVKSLLQDTALPAITQAVEDAETAAAQAAMYDGIRLNTVDALLADTSLTYTAGTPSSVVSGTYINTKAEGFCYQVASSGASNHHLITAGGVKLYVLTGAGPVNVKAFGAKGDGIANDAPAITKALVAFRNVYIPEGMFNVWSTITSSNVTIRGAGVSKTFIIGVSAQMPVDRAIFELNRSSVLESLHIEYDTLTGTEDRWQRVGIGTFGSDNAALARGSKIDKIRIKNCGTGISDINRGCFSVTFGTMEISGCSYAHMDINGTDRTGNVYENIYCGNSSYNMKYGLRFEGLETGGSWGQINVEHCRFEFAAVKIGGLVGAQIAALNIEGTDLSHAGGALIEISGSNVQFGTLTVLNTRQEVDNVCFMKLGTPDAVGAYRGPLPKVKIGVLHLSNIGCAALDSYPTARRGLADVVGWKFIQCSDTARVWKIEVDEYKWSCPQSEAADVLLYQNAHSWYSDSENFTLLRWSSKGVSMPAGENFIRNSLLKNWVNTTALVNTTTDIETATGWFGSTSTGALSISRQYDGFGKDAGPFIRMSNVGTPGTYQDIYQEIAEFRALFDEPLVLSFDARADVAGQAFSNINLSFYNSGGSPSYIYRKAANGPSSYLRLTTGWRRFAISVPSFLSSQIVSLGAAPLFRLSFEINNDAPSRERVIDLRNIKIERGTEETRFGALIN